MPPELEDTELDEQLQNEQEIDNLVGKYQPKWVD